MFFVSRRADASPVMSLDYQVHTGKKTEGSARALGFSCP